MKRSLLALAAVALIIATSSTPVQASDVPVAPATLPEHFATLLAGSRSDGQQMQVVATSFGFVVASGPGNLRAYSTDGTLLWRRIGLIATRSAKWNGFAVSIEPELDGTRILVSWALKNFRTPAFLISAKTGKTLWASTGAEFLTNGMENNIEPNGNGNVFVAAGPSDFAVRERGSRNVIKVVSLSSGHRLANRSMRDPRVPQIRWSGGSKFKAVQSAYLDKSTGFIVRVNSISGTPSAPKAVARVTVFDAAGKIAWSRKWQSKPFIGTWHGSTFDLSSYGPPQVGLDRGHLTLQWEPWTSDKGRSERQFPERGGHLRWKADPSAGLSGNDKFGTWLDFATGAPLGLATLYPTNDGNDHANDLGVVGRHGTIHRIQTGCNDLEHDSKYGPYEYIFQPRDVDVIQRNHSWYLAVAMTCVTAGRITSTGVLKNLHQKDVLFVIDATHHEIVSKLAYNPSTSRDVFGNSYEFGGKQSPYGAQSTFLLTKQGILTVTSSASSTHLAMYPLGSTTPTWKLTPTGWDLADSATSFALGDGTLAVLRDSGNATPLSLALYR